LQKIASAGAVEDDRLGGQLQISWRGVEDDSLDEASILASSCSNYLRVGQKYILVFLENFGKINTENTKQK